MWMWSRHLLRLHRPGTRFPTSRHRGPGAVVRHASGCVKEMIMTRTLALDPAATTYIFALLWCRLCISILSSGCGGRCKQTLLAGSQWLTGGVCAGPRVRLRYGIQYTAMDVWMRSDPIHADDKGKHASPELPAPHIDQKFLFIFIY